MVRGKLRLGLMSVPGINVATFKLILYVVSRNWNIFISMYSGLCHQGITLLMQATNKLANHSAKNISL